MSARRLLDPRWHLMVAALGKVFDDLDAQAVMVGMGVNAVIPGQGEQPPEHVAWLVDMPGLGMRKVAIMPGAEDAFDDLMAENVIDLDAPADVAGAEQDRE